MTSKKYMKLFKEEIIHEYKKGKLPIKLSKEILDNMIKNNNNKEIKFYSDFSDFIAHILNKFHFFSDAF